MKTMQSAVWGRGHSFGLLVGLVGVLLGLGMERVSAGECDNWQTLHPEWESCQDFESGLGTEGWEAATSDPTRLYIGTAMPFQGNRSLEWRYQANFDDGGPHVYKFLSRSYTDLYTRFYLRLSDNWTYQYGGGNGAATKGSIFYGDIPGTPPFYMMQDMWGINQPRTQVHRMKDSSNGPYTSDWLEPTSSFTWQNGRWYCVEEHVKLNTPGTANGVMERWIDGVLQSGHYNREFIGSSPSDPAPSTSRFDFLFVAGSKFSQPDGPQYRWYDNYIGSSQRIGCAGTPPLSDTTAPSIPTNLVATAVSSSQINLSWTASTDDVGVTGYRLERCTGSTCTTFTQIATPSGTTYNDTGLLANTTYRYRVRARDGAGNLSGYSSMVSATTQAPPVSGWPNEPPDSTFITENPWNPGYFPCNGCYDAFGWQDVQNNVAIVQNPNGQTVPASPPNVLQFHYTTTQGADNAPDIVGTSVGSNHQLYTGMWLMVNDAMRQAGGGVKIVEIAQVNAQGAYAGYIIPVLNTEGNNVVVRVYIPEQPAGTTLNNCHLANVLGEEFGCSPGSVNVRGNVIPDYAISTDAWHRIETYVQAATTATSNDGILRVWINGTLVMNYTNVDTDPHNFTDVVLAPTYGGVPPNNSIFLWYDNVRVSVPSGTSDTTAPTTPTNLTATAVSSSQINLSWTASTDNVGVTGYRVERCQGSTCTTFVQIATPSATSHNDTGLTANTTYRYRVRAADAAGTLSEYSGIVSATTRGDLDGNGTVDLDDLRRLIYMLVGTVPKDLLTADLDGDGQLLLVDLQALVRILVGLP